MKKLLSAVYFGGMVAEMVLRAPYDRRRRQIAKVDQRVTGAERGVLAGLLVSIFVLPLAHSLSGRLGFADYRLPPVRARVAGGLGGALLAAAVWLFWRAHRDLGANWSPSLEIGAQHSLMTGGVYGAVRHPMYASHLLWALAQALLLQNWLAGPSSLLTFLALYAVRVPQEERMMLEHFGDAYRDYCARTGRILPRLARRR